jgi:hypothetical protein
MPDTAKLDDLRLKINESLRVQRGTESIDYINVGNALNDASARQNHAVFARRGCGKTLLLHTSASQMKQEYAVIYLNCEDFKRHSFPNVLIEILKSIFLEIDAHLYGWFGRKRRLKEIVKTILARLEKLKNESDSVSEDVRHKTASAENDQFGIDAALGIDSAKVAGKGQIGSSSSDEIERTFKLYREKLTELDHWLPDLKREIREFFELSKEKKFIFLQIDDLYHLRRTDQAFVVDYIHRLCKDVPMFFKIATLRHASSLYADRQGQPIGAQERHDYQSINIDYTFSDFNKTSAQNWEILKTFGDAVDLDSADLDELFKGQGWNRLVMAGGGVPRDVLSLFLEMLSRTDVGAGEKIGKDEMRILSRENFERRIEELKQDSQDEEQGDLLKGIYIIREFCLEKKTNIFMVQERLLQQNDALRALFYRLMDYRIIHNCATALTHKSAEGTFQAFAIDIGCYAHLRKLHKRFNEIDVSDRDARERMRSAPIIDQKELVEIARNLPSNVEEALLAPEDDV